MYRGFVKKVSKAYTGGLLHLQTPVYAGLG